MRIKHKLSENNENNIFWITMTDLMTALVLVFIVLFFYMYITNLSEKIQAQVEQNKVASELQQNLEALDIKASVDSKTGIVKISDLELFDLNSHELSENGKQYLSKFTPAYLNSLFNSEYLSKHVDKILIQGHTDSQMFKGNYSEDEQYMKNMELSMKRAYSVANYMINTPYNKNNGNKLRKMVICEGASYSSPIYNDKGKEDFAKSRRVELKIIMNDKMSNNYNFFIRKK